MRQIYVITVFFLPFWCFSQLYIQPFEDRDSFVYVEGQLLYVTKEINLKVNSNEETRASIYLRNEAQLLQGNENIANTGNGLLSIFQEGNASQFTYNYWGLPVKSTSAENHFGNIFFEPITRTHSIPVKITSAYDGYAKPLTISNRWIYKLSGQDYADWTYIGNNFNISPGEGFTMKGVSGINSSIVLYDVPNNPGNEQRYDFRGSPNSGTYVLNIRKDEILLLGNPYPSALHLNTFLINNTSTTGIAYFWDSKSTGSHYLREYEGGYGAYSPGVEGNGYVPPIFYKYDESGTPTDQTGERGIHFARKYAPVGQGFLVEGSRDGVVNFNNGYRIYKKESPESSQFRSSATNNIDKGEMGMLRLQVDFNDLYLRELLLAFDPVATTGIDRAKDARNITQANSDAGWLIEKEILLIHMRPQNDGDFIPLYISIEKETEAEISLAVEENIKSNIFLLDSENGIYYNLKTQEVKFSLSAGEYKNRFFLTFNNPSNISPHQELIENNRYRIFQNNNLQQTEISAPLSSSSESISLFDSAGRKVRELIIKEGEVNFQLPTNHLSKGIYIVKILSGDGTVISKKVIISNF